MSSNFRLFLSRQAEADVEAILHYSYQTYGRQQGRAYRQALQEGFNRIEENPYLGHRRFDLLPDYRVWRVKQHLIIYKIIESNIYIARILHSRMDISRHL